MQYRVRLEGKAPVIHHSGLGIDPEHPANKEIAKITSKPASKRAESENIRIRDLETIKSLWLGDDERPAIPAFAIRSCIETAARKLREGPAVREGLIVLDSRFEYDTERYGETLEELSKSTQFTVPVRVQRARIMRTRARFDTPWAVVFEIDADDQLVDAEKLANWLDIAGRRIGLGDWRPEKSGVCGRFGVSSITAI